jgi:hypothetical protein
MDKRNDGLWSYQEEKARASMKKKRMWPTPLGQETYGREADCKCLLKM